MAILCMDLGDIVGPVLC